MCLLRQPPLPPPSSLFLPTLSPTTPHPSLSPQAAAQQQQPKPAPSNAVVYVNGDILTVAGDKPEYVAAVAVKGGRIVYAGDRAGAVRAAGAGAAIKDLAGRFMMPGFVDAHGHMVAYAHNLMNADLTGAKSVAEVVERLKAHAKTVPPGAWVEGFG